jgi:hypothetical protein
MRIPDLVRVVRHRPIYRRLCFAFTVGVFLSGAMSFAEEETVYASAVTPSWTTPTSGGADA